MAKTKATRWRHTLPGLLFLAVALLLWNIYPVQAATFRYVAPGGAGNRDGSSWENALPSIQAALDQAQPGDTIYLAPGDYPEALVTKVHGLPSQPITLVGPATAVLRGSNASGRIFQIFHDYYVLDGWTINGYDGSGNSKSDYRDKLLYVHGQRTPYNGEVRRGPQGLEVKNMTLLNAGGECIRLRYFVRGAHIHHNTIQNCGVWDFVFRDGGKNGEGIYLGTSSEQWNDGKNPTNDPDGSTENYIHDNVFNTQGNECIEVKEGAYNNIIENNLCTGGRDPEAGGLVARGDNNIFRNNISFGHAGGGIRFGGHQVNGHTYGANNSAYGNLLYNNQAGGIKFENRLQAQICGNTFVGPTGETQANPAYGAYGSVYSGVVAAFCNGAPVPTATVTLPPPTATATALPSATATLLPTPTPTATALPTMPPLPSPTVTPTAQPTSASTPVATNLLFVSSSSNGVASQQKFRDEDIMAFDSASGQWALYFDGSDVRIEGDLDAFAWMSDGTLLLSLQKNTKVPGLGEVDDADLLRFTPTTLGANTSGLFSLYFDGSDVGLNDDGEDIDALALLPDGRLLISTSGSFKVGELEGKDEDLLTFTPTSLGENTAGAWALYFDGSDITAPAIGKELWGVWVDSAGQLYLSTESAILGDEDDDSVDLFRCQPVALGNETACPLTLFWDGYANGYGDDEERIDGVDIGPAQPAMLSAIAAGNAAGIGDDTDDLVADAQADYDLEDYDEEVLQHFYLPLLTR
jgi:hypothetical protein